MTTATRRALRQIRANLVGDLAGIEIVGFVGAVMGVMLVNHWADTPKSPNSTLGIGLVFVILGLAMVALGHRIGNRRRANDRIPRSHVTRGDQHPLPDPRGPMAS